MTISVITPTYKGRKKLLGVFDSLKSQTFKDFEWIIVLDGYDEDTVSLIESFADNNLSFGIKWFVINHNHKKSAYNEGLKKASGEFIVVADDDDTFPKDSFEIFLKMWDSIPDNEKETFIGVTGLCGNEQGEIIGDKFPHDSFKSDALECSLAYNIKGEKGGMMRREILLEYLFFEKPQGYVGESTVWFAIAKKYKTLYFNEIVRIYKFNPDSIMNSKLSRNKIKNNCQGYCYGYRDPLLNHLNYFFKNPRWFLVCIVQYTKYLFFSIYFKKYERFLSPFVSMKLVFLMLLFSPISIFFIIKEFVTSYD